MIHRRLFHDPKKTSDKKFNTNSRAFLKDGYQTISRNSFHQDSTTNADQSLMRKLARYSSYRQIDGEKVPPQSRLSSVLSSVRMEPKIIVGERWLSNKQYNTRISASAHPPIAKTKTKPMEAPPKQKSTRTNTYQASNGQLVHERVYPAEVKQKLSLRVAVNGASKSMRGEIPLSNLNLTDGDFGDDAGMTFQTLDYYFVGLADGASGNRSLGINPADFSRAILATCRRILRQSDIQPNQLPKLVLSAMQHVEASDIRGSSTLCLLALDKRENTLSTINIGDSGFVVCRDNQIYRRSTCTMSASGAGPRQLFAVDNNLALPCFLNEDDLLCDCSLDTIAVQKDDIIILSSDGLWDVLHNNQLLEIIKQNANKNPQDLADALLSRAVEGYIVNGRDDILVIVCRVETT